MRTWELCEFCRLIVCWLYTAIFSAMMCANVPVHTMTYHIKQYFLPLALSSTISVSCAGSKPSNKRSKTECKHCSISSTSNSAQHVSFTLDGRHIMTGMPSVLTSLVVWVQVTVQQATSALCGCPRALHRLKTCAVLDTCWCQDASAYRPDRHHCGHVTQVLSVLCSSCLCAILQ